MIEHIQSRLDVLKAERETLLVGLHQRDGAIAELTQLLAALTDKADIPKEVSSAAGATDVLQFPVAAEGSK